MALTDYFKGSYNELVNKVSWPTWQELFNSAIIVLITSLIFALIIFVMDRASDTVVNFIYRLFG